jgi:hypothetical protein
MSDSADAENRWMAALRERRARGDLHVATLEDVERLIAEREAVRALPMLRTCRPCAYESDSACHHPTHPAARPVIIYTAPPEWCPLREGAR